MHNDTLAWRRQARYLFVSFICSFVGIFFQSCVWSLKFNSVELCWSPIAYFAIIFQCHEPWQRQFFIKREKHSIGTSEHWKSLKQYHIVKPVKSLPIRENYLYFVTSINVQLLWLLSVLIEMWLLHKATFAILMHYLLMRREKENILLMQEANSFSDLEILSLVKRIASHRNCMTD